MEATNEHREHESCPAPALIRKALFSWYDRHARDLPWRREQDPYRIWLSEIMLQQTQVDTVIPYYTRFLQAYPTLEDLCDAEEGAVLKLWEGLGYYARARHFLEAVREVQTRYGGRIPQDSGEFKGLPGVGDYTAAAVLSIVYNIPLAAVDGNIKRVLSRLYCLEDDLQKSSGRKKIQLRANELLDSKKPGDFNQALMDLGSSICTPRLPACTHCPLKGFCLALKRNKIRDIPKKKKQKPLPQREFTALIIQRGERYLVRQRPRKGLLGGLWEFPTLSPGVLLSEQVSLNEKIADLSHTFSHLQWKVSLYWGELKGELPRDHLFRWVTAEELVSLPFPTVYHSIVQSLKNDFR